MFSIYIYVCARANGRWLLVDVFDYGTLTFWRYPARKILRGSRFEDDVRNTRRLLFYGRRNGRTRIRSRVRRRVPALVRDSDRKTDSGRTGFKRDGSGCSSMNGGRKTVPSAGQTMATVERESAVGPTRLLLTPRRQPRRQLANRSSNRMTTTGSHQRFLPVSRLKILARTTEIFIERRDHRARKRLFCRARHANHYLQISY